MTRLPILNKRTKEYKTISRFRIEGEPAFLRPIKTRDETDIERYRKAFDTPGAERYFDGQIKSLKKKELVKLLRSTEKALVYAVADLQDKNKRMQGWIQVTPDESHRIKRIRGLEEKAKSGKYLIVEISYARYSGVRQKNKVKGLISSGVRSALVKVQVLEQLKSDKEKRKARKILVNAYVDKHNTPSIRVLEHSGFKKQGKILYHNPKYKKYSNEEELLYFRKIIR
jgi:hypothetical protein